MTVVEADRIEMANSSDELTLDNLFRRLERMPVPEGYKVEIVGGSIHMSPQRQTHWEIIFSIARQLAAVYAPKRLASDVRIDFPGYLNGFACDVAAFTEHSRKNAKGLWRYQDIEFVAEVISKDTAANDYGPKKASYAEAGIPVYLIVDPYVGKCLLHTCPEKGDYASEAKFDFGDEIDLTHTPVGLALTTDDFPRD
ncbi:Uma2 family endonuclease [Streptomyces sp. PR69]|uniref:Uma2 family endonuclease n=1 Tax=Streptomyces sp. PR69 TaxID=2984950 RepID=UPI00226476CE|nr:Uma2 family endonuclease [Streptomyces sp. PR69]